MIRHPEGTLPDFGGLFKGLIDHSFSDQPFRPLRDTDHDAFIVDDPTICADRDSLERDERLKPEQINGKTYNASELTLHILDRIGYCRHPLTGYETYGWFTNRELLRTLYF